VRDLTGRWQWQDNAGNTMTLVFSLSGRLLILVTGDGTPTIAQEVLYQVHSNFQPMHLDLTLNDTDRFETIFGLSAQDQLYIELSQIQAGQTRPEAFSPQVLTFTRLDKTPTPPPGMQILRYEDRINQLREAQARAYLDALIQAQETYYQNQGHYADQWDDFVAGLQSDAPFYHYAVVLQSDQKSDQNDRIIVTATAKVEGIRSYIANTVRFSAF
jgi:hypothetical protein